MSLHSLIFGEKIHPIPLEYDKVLTLRQNLKEWPKSQPQTVNSHQISTTVMISTSGDTFFVTVVYKTPEMDILQVQDNCGFFCLSFEFEQYRWKKLYGEFKVTSKRNTIEQNKTRDFIMTSKQPIDVKVIQYFTTKDTAVDKTQNYVYLTKMHDEANLQKMLQKWPRSVTLINPNTPHWQPCISRKKWGVNRKI